MVTRGYHFVGATLRDGQPIPADGVWLEHDGPVVICESGLHASLCPLDALTYAPGETLCLVDLEELGDSEDHADKVVARRRRIVARVDATPLLRQFARRCASDVLHLWDAPEVVKQYLATGDEALRAAARDAASDAAWAAARDAARDAASAAARDAAWDAAWAAAWDAAWAAARDAARDAAWDAAWAAAWAAAMAPARARFRSMVDAAFAEVQR
jgi:hypothetical protein